MLKAIRTNRWQALAGVTILGFAAAVVYAEERRADPSKRQAEARTEKVVAGSQALAGPRQSSAKAEVEAPAERVIGTSSSPAFNNPKVEPGKVKWHASLETACAAAKRSGKPVLLFQMMGKLDDQFC